MHRGHRPSARVSAGMAVGLSRQRT